MTQNLEKLIVAERRKYQREWRAKNRDKVAATQRRYWENRALRTLQAQENEEGGAAFGE